MRRYLTTLSIEEADSYRASGAWESTTLLDVAVRRASDQPKALALHDEQLRLSNAEMARAVAHLAGFLSGRDIGPGEPVIVQLRNSSIHGLVNIALSAVGAVIVPVKVSLRSQEMSVVAARVGSRWAIVETDSEAATLLPGSGVEVIEEQALREAARAGEAPRWDPTSSRSHADAVLDLMFTSGTTGSPKGIVNTTNTKLSALRATIRELALGADDAWLVVPPMAHNAGWLYSFLPALLSGAAAVFQSRFDPAETLALLNLHRIRAVFLTPTHASDVLGAIRSGLSGPTDLRYVLIGGAATPPRMKADLRDALGAEVIAMYGSTENQGVTFVRPGTPPVLADPTVGLPCPGNEVAIFGDGRRRSLPVGEVGEIGTRGAGTFVGYFDDQPAVDACMNEDGWFFAGDLGHLDEHGALHIVGRTKEVIIRGGLNIVPEDVEAALADHPLLERVAAVGVPDERFGERVCAVVISRAPAVDLAALVAHLRDRGVGTHLWPEALVRVDEFPLTDLGKVQRAALREVAIEAAQSGAIERRADVS